MLGDDRRGVIPEMAVHRARLYGWRSVPTPDQAAALVDGLGGFRGSRGPAGGRLRVGLWAPCLGLGGAESWMLALARHVDPDRVSWRGLAVTDSASACSPEMADALGRFMPVGYGRHAARVLAAESDAILSWSVLDVDGLLDGLADRPRVVQALHFPAEATWGPRTADLLAGVDRLVAVSELALEAVPDPLRGRASVIWNAVDPGRLVTGRDRPAVRSSWDLPAGALVAGYLGRLAPEKDPDAMIRLAACLPEPWHAVLVGDGRDREALDARARSTGSGRIRLVGGDPASGDILGAFDALVVPSLYESFGLSLAEGLWSGVPVIATRVGLAKLRPGLVREVPVHATGRELAEALLADRADGPGTRGRVDRAREFAHDRLHPARFGREWTDLLLDLVPLTPSRQGARHDAR